MRKKACSDILPRFLHCSTKNLTQRFAISKPLPLENLKRAGLFFLEIIHRRAPTRRVRCLVRQVIVDCLTRHVAATLAQGRV